MPGEFLPPVITKLELDIDDLVTKAEEAKAIIKSIGDVSIPINFDLNAASLASTLSVAKTDAAAAHVTVPVGFDVSTLSGAKLLGIAALSREARLASAAMTGLAATATATRGPIAAWWATWGNVVHWVAALSFEILAVGIPALIAMGSAYMVANEAIQNTRAHMSSLYNVQEATYGMFHQTAGQALGLGDALQKAQTAANPHVYELLGAALDAVKGHESGFISMGNTMIGVLDRFGAKVDMEINGPLGHQLTGFLSNATQDATMFGQVFGNLGHIIANVAMQMPGLAEILLHILDFLTTGISDVTSFAGRFSFMGFTVLTAAMAFEEFNRWGGVVVSLLGRFGLATSAVTGGMFSVERASGVFMNLFRALPMLVANSISTIGSYMARFGTKWSSTIGMAGAEMRNFGADMADATMAIETGPAIAITALAAGLGFLIYKMATAKSAAQEFTASLQEQVTKTSDLNMVTRLGTNLTVLSQKYEQASIEAQKLGFTQQTLNNVAVRGGGTISQAAQAMGTYSQAIQQTEGQLGGVSKNVAAIMKQFGVSYPQALAIAQGANVNLATSTVRFGRSLTLTGQEIKNYLMSVHAMGASSNAFGTDLNAMDIQTQLAATKIQNLNSALDQMMGYITGGTGDLSQFSTALSGMSKSSAASSASLSGSISSISRAANQNIYTLKGWSANAQQSWQQFDGVLSGSGQQLADWFRTAGAMGVMSSQQFGQAMKYMVAQMLPFTQGNKTAVSELSALAQQAGGPSTNSLKVLAAWVGHTGDASKALRQIIDEVTQKMSNMSQVAQNLGGVLNSQVDSAMAGAIIQNSKLNAAIEQYAKDLDTLGPKNQATISALDHLHNVYDTVMKSANSASGGMRNFGNSSSTAAGQAREAASATQHLQDVLNALHGKTVYVNVIQEVSSQVLHGIASAGYAANAGSGGNRSNLPAGYGVYTGQSANSSPGGTQHVHVHVDGHELFSWMQEQTYAYDVNNGNRHPSGSVRGSLAPR